MAPIDIWGPRYCPFCGAWPGESCRTTSGARAGLPHRERYSVREQGKPRIYGKKLAKKRQMRQERIEAAARLPLDLRLRQIMEERQVAHRERQLV